MRQQKFLPLFSLWIIRIIFDLKHFISITVARPLGRIVQKKQQWQRQQLLKFVEAEDEATVTQKLLKNAKTIRAK